MDACGSIPGRGREGILSLCHSIHTPESYPMGTGGSFLGVKQPGREADH
jgi:hypothetical protein